MPFVVLGALVIGITLGLMGSGGSILTLPVLTYLLGHDSKVAVAESLAIVGGIALVGIIPYARARQVDLRSVLLFGLPGMLGTYAGAWLSRFVAGGVQLILFAMVMLLAAYLMLRGPRLLSRDSSPPDSHPRQPVWKIASEGLVVGVLTGLVGVGGGFLIVPALVLLGGLPMRLAIGTSLAVIAMKSFSGFYKYLQVLEHANLSVHWPTVASFIAIGMLGSLTGNMIGSHVNQTRLRQGFAVFLLIMGILVLGKETPALFALK